MTSNNPFTTDIKDILRDFEGKRICVLAGGLSDEREISLRSGNNVFNALKSFPSLDVHFVDADERLSQTLLEKNVHYVYNILHGTYGEDGIVQGVLELLGIPYTGENVLTSAICMDKLRTKEIWGYNGLLTPKHALLSSYETADETGSLIGGVRFDFPFVIKDRANGSSVGVYLVKTKYELEKIQSECARDMLVEEYVKGREMTVGIMRREDDLFVFPVLEIKPKNEFYDFEAKYTKGMTEFEIPANLPSPILKNVISLVKRAYETLDCKGVCRIDVILTNDNVPYLIENNTQPGMTDTSDIPEMAAALGIPFNELVLNILWYSVIKGRA